MKVAIRHIDRALKKLYNIDTIYRAESFLLKKPMFPARAKVASQDFHGALYLRGVSEDGASNDLSVGIYLSDSVKSELAYFPKWKKHWTGAQLRAFTVATEEVSHFHYLLYNAHRKRPVSQFELEFQAEIDKFLLLYFYQRDEKGHSDKIFLGLFEQLFFNFRLSTHLSQEEKVRYLDANQFGKKFVHRLRRDLSNPRHLPKVLAALRKFYRMNLSEKISYLHL